MIIITSEPTNPSNGDDITSVLRDHSYRRLNGLPFLDEEGPEASETKPLTLGPEAKPKASQYATA